MCGIIGTFSVKKTTAETQRVHAGLQAMRHRGPNGDGTEVFKTQAGTLVLGHKRLAIIDLSDAGRQPIKSNCGRYTMTFNGEIYNYIELRAELATYGVTFNTATDTEVLLAAWVQWGEECLSRLDGMFAFVIFDSLNETLHCANDPFGIKPLYYCEHDGSFSFASEIPALREVTDEKPSLNVQNAVSFLLWGTHDQGSETFISGICRLKPGHVLQYSLRGNRITRNSRWWNPSLKLNASLSFEEAADKLRLIFLNSVRRQLRSDVPLGFALSGGLDSSAIVSAVRYLEPDYPIRTFSYVSSQSSLNEVEWADIVNTHVGAQAHYICDSDDDFDLDAAMLSQGEPFGGTSILASLHVFQRMQNEGVVVSLDGQGADEAIGGYDGYPQAIIRDCLDKGDYSSAFRFITAWSNWPGRSKAATIQLLGDMFLPERMRGWATQMIGYDAAPKWLNIARLEHDNIFLGPPPRLTVRPENHGRRLAERLETALTDVGLPRLLRYADRNSMHFSIESRVPFLTPELSEFMLTMPAKYLVSLSGQSKHLFRAAMKGIVPDQILNRRDKIGFETPELKILLKNRLKVKTWVQSAEEIPFLDAGQVQKTVNKYLDNELPYRSRCWRLINFCRWHSQMNIKSGSG